MHHKSGAYLGHSSRPSTISVFFRLMQKSGRKNYAIDQPTTIAIFFASVWLPSNCDLLGFTPMKFFFFNPEYLVIYERTYVAVSSKTFSSWA